jgi:uncharacterized protein (TIGR03435 family)
MRRLLVSIVLVISAQFVSSQDFEAASIKRSAPGNLRGSTFEFLPGGGLRIANGTLKAILETAYEIRDFQILGGPGWVNSEQYDILARSGDRPPRRTATEEIGAVRQRLQRLLAQRFKLEVHREMREVPEYALEIAKNGPNLIEIRDSSNQAGTGIQRSCGKIIGTNTTAANLSVYLSRQLERPVLDRTGLTGRYSFQFEWTPDTGPCPGSPENAPSIFTALQEKLGLKLESIKGPVDALVIDHAEKPSDN